MNLSDNQFLRIFTTFNGVMFEIIEDAVLIQSKGLTIWKNSANTKHSVVVRSDAEMENYIYPKEFLILTLDYLYDFHCKDEILDAQMIY